MTTSPSARRGDARGAKAAGTKSGNVVSLGEVLEWARSSRATWRNTVARVRYFHEQVRQKKYPNTYSMADHFEISRRTVLRDVEAIRNSLDLPLEYCPVRKGYYYTRDVPSDLPRPKLTPGDSLAFCLARRALEQFRGTDFAELFDAALQKFMDEVDGEMPFGSEELDALVSFGPRGRKRPATQPIAAAVSEALLRRHELQLSYWNLDGQKHEPRRLQPLHLWAYEETLFLFALDPQRTDGEVRRFVLSRMKNVRVTRKTFERPAGFDPDEEMRHSVGACRGEKPVPVRLGLSARATRLLDERPLHPTQKIVLRKRASAKGTRRGADREDGIEVPALPPSSPEYCRHATLTMKVAITPELEQKILQWGADIEVLEPTTLRERVVEVARVIVGRKL